MHRPLARRALSALALLVVAGCKNPRVDANTAEALIEFNTQLNTMQQDQALLQSQVDSLRGVVAQQDTIIRQLAAMANVPVPR